MFNYFFLLIGKVIQQYKHVWWNTNEFQEKRDQAGMLEGSMSTQRKGIFHEGVESGVHVCVAQAPVDHGDLLLHMLALPPNCTRFFLCIQLSEDPWAVAFQAPLFLRFSRQRYWSEMTFPWTSEDLSNLGIESPPPALAGRFFNGSGRSPGGGHGNPL